MHQTNLGTRARATVAFLGDQQVEFPRATNPIEGKCSKLELLCSTAPRSHTCSWGQGSRKAVNSALQVPAMAHINQQDIFLARSLQKNI